MRKLITSMLLVAFCILSFCPNTVTANPSMTVQKATEIAKSIITIPDDIKNFSSNYSEYKGRGLWDLRWETEEGFISVSIDALTGEITQFHQYSSDPHQTNLFPTINRTTAIKIANEFLAKAVPSKYSSLKIVEPDYNEGYGYNQQNINLHYQRLVNNIPYAQNSAYITISGVNGQVLNFNLSWDYDLDFKSPKGIINKEKAEDILKDKALELMYYKPYDPKEKVLLVYGVRQPSNSYVDAHTGEYTTISPYYRLMADKAMGNAGPASPELSPIELKEIDTIKGLLSKEEAINIVKKHIVIPDDFSLTHSALYQDYQNKDMRRWSFDWQSKGEEYTRYISAAIDAKSGELLSFYKPPLYTSDREKQKANYTYEQGKKIAEDFITRMQPQKAKQIKFNETQQPRLLMEISIPPQPDTELKEVGYEFIRLVNDIPFYDDKFNLTVDLITGEVIYYNYNWSNLKFPSPNMIINKDKAFSILTKDNEVKLEYIHPYDFYIEQEANKKVGLYYHFSTFEPRLVDAFKGVALNNNGEEFKKKTLPRFNDIKGHPAEDDINTLVNLGIITGNEEGLFLPNNNITNAEFIKMLVMAIGAYPGEGRKIESLGDEWYSPYYQTAINRKIIDKDNLPSPNEHLTRLKAAHMLIRAMNLAYIADLQGIYKISAQDANTVMNKDIGYMALTTELGLIPLKNNKLSIHDPMQRGESASTIVHLMKIYKR
ncbi:MAG: S-layer homology domain-containing protein [Syntrophomonadaceae bacterium]|nr:S-layer homology domain-containing protein [Syntrophomonadaceae bacterium]